MPFVIEYNEEESYKPRLAIPVGCDNDSFTPWQAQCARGIIDHCLHEATTWRKNKFRVPSEFFSCMELEEGKQMLPAIIAKEIKFLLTQITASTEEEEITLKVINHLAESIYQMMDVYIKDIEEEEEEDDE